MKRNKALKQAKQIIMSRNDNYGDPADNFETIANYWSTYLAITVQAYDVAIMMALLKITRIDCDPGFRDSWLDLIGYAAIGAEMADC